MLPVKADAQQLLAGSRASIGLFITPSCTPLLPLQCRSCWASSPPSRAWPSLWAMSEQLATVAAMLLVYPGCL